MKVLMTHFLVNRIGIIYLWVEHTGDLKFIIRAILTVEAPLGSAIALAGEDLDEDTYLELDARVTALLRLNPALRASIRKDVEVMLSND